VRKGDELPDFDGLRELITARRGPLERERFAAQLDVEIAEQQEDTDLLEEPQRRLGTVEAQIKVLDDKEAEIDQEEADFKAEQEQFEAEHPEEPEA